MAPPPLGHVYIARRTVRSTRADPTSWSPLHSLHLPFFLVHGSPFDGQALTSFLLIDFPIRTPGFTLKMRFLFPLTNGLAPP